MNGWEKGGELDGEYQNLNQVSLGWQESAWGSWVPVRLGKSLKEKKRKSFSTTNLFLEELLLKWGGVNEHERST